MSQRLRPNFGRSPTLRDISKSYNSAKEALAAGNHYLALLKARTENERNIEHAALIMCGATKLGLNGLESGILPQEAYGQWCLGNKEAVKNILKNYQEFNYLNSLLVKPVIKIFILFGPHTKQYVPSKDLTEFEIASVCLKRDEKAPSLSEIMPQGFQPDAIIILDIYGHRLPNDLYNFSGPIIFLNYDFDVQLSLQHQDLQRADLIVGNGAYEHYFLNRIYKTPVSVFPAIVIPFEKSKLIEEFYDKNIDFLHTGLSFTPTMREKAQFLFRIATIDNPDLNIRIHHGFLDSEDYLSQVRRSKFMPIFNSRMYGGIQSRTIDAVINGSIAFHGCEDVAIDLFDAGGIAIRYSSPVKLELDIAENLANYPENIENLKNNQSSALKEIAQFFIEPAERDIRFIKYCLFEAARLSHKKMTNNQLRTTSVVGITQCLNLARKDKENSQNLYSLALYRAIEACLHSPLNQNNRDKVNSIFEEGSSIHPNSLAMLFNYARFQWMIDKKKEAYDKFEFLNEGLLAHYFEPTKDLVWLNLFENASEMMPIQDYFTSVTIDIASGDLMAKNGRSIVGATSLSYMALYHLQREELNDGLQLLEQALTLYPTHFPAARLKFKTLHALGENYDAVAKAFDDAVNLYPPTLTDVLSFGVSNELAQNKEDKALSLVKSWVYFITRCTWDRETGHKIPESNWKTVRAFFHRLPERLQRNLKTRFPEIDL